MRNLQNYRLDICETFVVGEIFIGMLLPQWLLSFILGLLYLKLLFYYFIMLLFFLLCNKLLLHELK